MGAATPWHHTNIIPQKPQEVIPLGDNDEIVRLQEQVKTLFSNQKDLKEMFEGVINKLDEMQKSFQNRLPPWATAVISILTAACGWLAGR